jgi:hypothetical protein
VEGICKAKRLLNGIRVIEKIIDKDCDDLGVGITALVSVKRQAVAWQIGYAPHDEIARRTQVPGEALPTVYAEPTQDAMLRDNHGYFTTNDGEVTSEIIASHVICCYELMPGALWPSGATSSQLTSTSTSKLAIRRLSVGVTRSILTDAPEA